MANNRGSSRIGGQLAAHLGNLLDLIKVVQGPGSGIDADTVDSIEGASIVRNDVTTVQRISSISVGNDNEIWTVSATKRLWLNYRGYDGSITNYNMDTAIGDGKGNAVLYVTGATKSVATTKNTLDDGSGNATFAGNISTSGTTLKIGPYFVAGSASTGFFMDSANGAYRSQVTSGNSGFYFQNNATVTNLFVGLNGTYAGRVGIGTITPAYALDLNNGNVGNVGQMGVTKIGVGTNAPAHKIHIVRPDPSTESDIFLQSMTGNDWKIYTPATSNDLRIWSQSGTNGDVVTIQNTGFVGIGTSSPTSTLHVNGSLTTVGNVLLEPSAERHVKAYGTNINWGSYYNNTGLGAYDWQNGRFVFQYAAGTGAVKLGNTNTLVNTGNNTLDDGAGNVTISGTTTPLTVKSAGTAGSAHDMITLLNTVGATGNQLNINFRTYSSSNVPQARMYVIDQGAYSGDIVFATKIPGTDTNAMADRFRIYATGKVATVNNVLDDGSGALSTVGSIYVGGGYLNGPYGMMIRSTDEWLRINDDSSHANGIYCGSGILRTDGTFQVGGSGAKFNIDPSGNTTIAGMTTILGHGTVSGGSGETDVALNIQNVANASSSIVFSSGVNKTSDHAIIRYYDSAAENESIVGSGENSMLLIACENDGNQDRVRIRGAWVDIVGRTSAGTNTYIAKFKNASYVDKMTIDQNGSIITSGSLTVSGGTAITGDLTTSSNINLGKVLMIGTYTNPKSSISFYDSTYDTWQEYMAQAGGTNAINGTAAPTYGSVTGWARRSFIENVAGYGWIWESAPDKTKNNGTSTKPNAMMALDSTNGNLLIRGSLATGRNTLDDGSGNVTIIGNIGYNNNNLRFNTSGWTKTNGETKVVGAIADNSTTTGNARFMFFSDTGMLNVYVDGTIYVNEGANAVLDTSDPVVMKTNAASPGVQRLYRNEDSSKYYIYHSWVNGQGWKISAANDQSDTQANITKVIVDRAYTADAVVATKFTIQYNSAEDSLDFIYG